jgi:hypothetical protein
MRRNRAVCGAAGLASLMVGLLLVACEDVATEQAPSFVQAEAPAPSGSTERSGGGSPGSSLGAAKRAAQNTADQVEQRQNELAEQINKMQQGGGSE